ncbi:B3 domain-containing protein Os01g0723500-like [Phoenix dactylifera]|uniref:B3 domain-containing protein Os01g0723500-like n=1 Tax=Phoenix dactylifera TaxID=42345 RepID=A0A8B8JCJ1_PHODC|nr:B3 domain-containing protein Os01g0723500-like [Phoenix dactylifera]
MAGKRQQRSSRTLVRKPHFFKVLLGDFGQRLKIPPNFLKHISMEASRRVTLQGPSGSKWYVQLTKNIEGAFLTAGWPKFVKDHSLKEHEFLVFQYEGSMHFTVLIFDTTACEREDVLTVRPHRSSKSSNDRNKRGRPLKISLDVGCYVKKEASESELTDLRNDRHAPNQLQVHYSNSIQGRRMSPPIPCGDVKIKTEDDELPICMIGSPTRQYRGYVSRRRPVTAEERAKAREDANSFTSIFPHMIMRMTAMSVYRTYMLRIPAWFSRAHLPRKRTNLVLRDPNGKAWVVVYIPCSRDRLSGGWSAFSRGNNLEEGDYCAFELVGPVEMRVHIFRVVEETIPVIRMTRMQEMH